MEKAKIEETEFKSKVGWVYNDRKSIPRNISSV